MQETNLVVVHSFTSPQEAEIARGALEAAEIAAMIQADSVGGMEPNIAWANGGYRVLVRQEDLDEALNVLQPAVLPGEE
jgi:hypothetical protein